MTTYEKSTHVMKIANNHRKRSDFDGMGKLEKKTFSGISAGLKYKTR
jgi:hypothetical protein